jgi:hypothetical protein
MEKRNNNADIKKTRGQGAGGGASAKMAPATSPGNGSNTAGTAGTLLDEAKAKANDAYFAVADKASSVIEEQRSEFSGGLTGVADTVRRISGAIVEKDGDNGIAKFAAEYTVAAANKLEGAAQYFERTDLKGMARDVEAYARRNPAIFLGAAFAVGVLAARFFKSTANEDV